MESLGRIAPRDTNSRLQSHVIASEAKQSISPRKGRMDCFAALAMTARQSKRCWLVET
jgi:hypothetical protein